MMPRKPDDAVPDFAITRFRRFHCESHDQLRQHLAHFAAAFNFGRRFKSLKGLTPYEFIPKI